MDLEKQKKIAQEKVKELDKKIEAKKNISKKKGKTKFYNFRQNNSGGHFNSDENVCENVFIEAHNAEEANLLADSFGIYFDGCEQGLDCSCCGDRWYPVSEGEGEEKPMIYSQSKKLPVEEAFEDSFKKECIIHYLNGKKKRITYKTEKDCPGHKWKQRYDIGEQCEICGKWKK